MHSVERIEDPIVAGSEGFFDEPNIRENLHITIRIARDFYNFLVEFGENPSLEEVDFIMGTIRSGMDWFFGLADLCPTINTARETWRFDPHVNWDFPALRKRFMLGFERLASPDMSVVDRLASLLALTHLELVFLAQHFPSAIFGDGTGSFDNPESLSDLSELQAGRLSFDDVEARRLARDKGRP
jgi:hypothetical protein